MALPVTAQDGTAVQEQQPGGAVLDGPNPNGGLAPNDPNVGSVTHLPLPRYVTLKGNEGNARRGPGLTHRIDWVFTREGMPLKITAEYEHWRRVEDADGAGGWVHYSLLSGVRSVLISEDMAQAFSQPDEKSDVVFQSELGVIGKLLQCIPDWCRISVEGEKGWVQKSTIWGVDPTETYPAP
jgi:SH3-like domain-containing protein